MMSGMIPNLSIDLPGVHIHTPRVRSVDLRGPAGRLEAVVNEGTPEARFAAVVCHPHPKGGGTLHNKVAYHAMKALNAPEWGLGWPVLRFNFRGTGLSEGEHDGRAETGDVLAALDWLETTYRLPTVLVGFSFGAAMALKAATEDRHRLRAIAALGLPTHAEGRSYRYSFLKDLKVPKLFLSGDQDQFAPRAELERVAAEASDPKQIVLIPGADHFFAGRLEPMQDALTSWLKEQVL
jgi:uncharacterized protein